MPEGTFGHAYANFMGDRNFLAGDRPPVRFIDDLELAYVAARAREIHDFWHVLFGCHTNVFGELALKAVELVQVYNTISNLGADIGQNNCIAISQKIQDTTATLFGTKHSCCSMTTFAAQSWSLSEHLPSASRAFMHCRIVMENRLCQPEKLDLHAADWHANDCSVCAWWTVSAEGRDKG